MFFICYVSYHLFIIYANVLYGRLQVEVIPFSALCMLKMVVGLALYIR